MKTKKIKKFVALVLATVTVMSTNTAAIADGIAQELIVEPLLEDMDEGMIVEPLSEDTSKDILNDILDNSTEKNKTNAYLLSADRWKDGYLDNISFYVSGNEVPNNSLVKAGEQVQVLISYKDVFSIHVNGVGEMIESTRYVKALSPLSDYLPIKITEENVPKTDVYITEFTMPDDDAIVLVRYENCSDYELKRGNIHIQIRDVEFHDRNLPEHIEAKDGKGDFRVRCESLTEDVTDVLVVDNKTNVIPVNVEYVPQSGCLYRVTFDMPKDNSPVFVVKTKYGPLDPAHLYEKKINRINADWFSDIVANAIANSKDKDSSYESGYISFLGIDEEYGVETTLKKGKLVKNELWDLITTNELKDKYVHLIINAGNKIDIASMDYYYKPLKNIPKDADDYDLSVEEDNAFNACNAKIVSCDNPGAIKLVTKKIVKRYKSTSYYTHYKKYSIVTKAIANKPVTNATIKIEDGFGNTTTVDVVIRNVELKKDIKKVKLSSKAGENKPYKITLSDVGTGEESDIYNVGWDVQYKNDCLDNWEVSYDGRSVTLYPSEGKKGKVKINAYVCGKKYSTSLNVVK